MNRRNFVIGAVVSAGSLNSMATSQLSPPTTPKPPLSSWDEVRAQFNLSSKFINMSCYWQASHPTPVREAIDRHRKGLDACPSEYFQDNAERLETAVRTAAAEYFQGKPDDFAMTESTSQGLGTVYNALKLKAGQEILSTEQDHIVTKKALGFRAERLGTPVRTISLYERSDNVTEEGLVGAVIRAVTPHTRIVAVTWVQSMTGVKMPIGRLAYELSRINSTRAEDDRALLVVDGVHGLGVEDFVLSDLGCDCFIAGCHKWLFGPRGTGLVWANPSIWNNTTPIIPGNDHLWRHHPETELTHAAWMTPGGFHAFEHRWALTEAFRLHLQLGKAKVAARIHALNRQCKEGLAKMPHVKLQTPMSDKLSAGMVCFLVDGLSPKQTVDRLKTLGVLASTTPPYKYEYARVTPSLWNTPDEVDVTLRAIHSLG